MLTRKVDGRGVTLTGTGPFLWDLLDEPRTVEEVAATLAERFGSPVTTVASDVAETLDTLQRDGIVQAVP